MDNTDQKSLQMTNEGGKRMGKTSRHNLITVADNGDALETLRELRHKIAVALEECQSGRDIAALSRQLVLVVQQINELEGHHHTEETTLSMIRAKHAHANRVNQSMEE